MVENFVFNGFFKILNVLQNFFKKPLKFPQALPLPVLDTQKSACGTWVKKVENFLKFFTANPKVPQNPAVTGLDVAKKSQFSIAVYRLKTGI